MINFNMTPKAVEDLFLLDVIRSERPDLEDRRASLLQSVEEDQRLLTSAEDHALALLAGSSGSLLGDLLYDLHSILI